MQPAVLYRLDTQLQRRVRRRTTSVRHQCYLSLVKHTLYMPATKGLQGLGDWKSLTSIATRQSALHDMAVQALSGSIKCPARKVQFSESAVSCNRFSRLAFQRHVNGKVLSTQIRAQPPQRQPLGVVAMGQPMLAPRYLFDSLIRLQIRLLFFLSFKQICLWLVVYMGFKVSGVRRTQDMMGDPFGLLLRQRIIFLGGEVWLFLFFRTVRFMWLPGFQPWTVFKLQYYSCLVFHVPGKRFHCGCCY